MCARRSVLWSVLTAFALAGASQASAQEREVRVPGPGSAGVVVAPPPGTPPPPPPMLGVNIDMGYVWSGYAWEPGIRIVNVWPGYPAWGRLDPGDIITRVNGFRTRTIEEFRYAMAVSGGAAQLRVRDIRTGQMMDLSPIYVAGGGYPAAAGYTATGHIQP